MTPHSISPNRSDMDAPDQEMATLITLARGARARITASEGAAVRDDMGRTYASASIALSRLTLTAMQAAVAQAAAAGSRRIASAVIVTRDVDVRDTDLQALHDLDGRDAVLLIVAPDGTVVSQRTA